MKKIVAKDLVKEYNKKTVLSHVNIEMQGGVYGLLGPNGAGKSTLIGIMVDGIQNYSGEILYGNENIKKLGKDFVDLFEKKICILNIGEYLCI